MGTGRERERESEDSEGESNREREGKAKETESENNRKCLMYIMYLLPEHANTVCATTMNTVPAR